MQPDEIITALMQDEKYLTGIVTLQQKNLARNISAAEAREQGVVTVEHNYELLQRMSRSAPPAIATHHDRLVGYALVMLPHFRAFIPVLEPMFMQFDTLLYKNKNLLAYNYFVMGQVCIDKEYRGKGVFEKLYHTLRLAYHKEFTLMLTEVAARNTRSVRAHEKAGLQCIRQYTDAAGESWLIMLWEIT